MKNDKIFHFWAKSAHWYRYRKWVPVPIGQRQVVPVPKVSGTGTRSQKRVGTGTHQSGTSTDASSNLDFCSIALLSLVFVHLLVRDPNKGLMGVQIRMKLTEKRIVPRRRGEDVGKLNAPMIR